MDSRWESTRLGKQPVRGVNSDRQDAQEKSDENKYRHVIRQEGLCACFPMGRREEAGWDFKGRASVILY